MTSAGPIAYAEIKSRGQAWRIRFAATAGCAVSGCGAVYPDLVFDHCHEHGWVRGMLCVRHNTRAGQIDAVMRIPGARVDLSATPYAALLAGCIDCGRLSGLGAFEVPAVRAPVLPRPPRQPLLPQRWTARARAAAAAHDAAAVVAGR